MRCYIRNTLCAVVAVVLCINWLPAQFAPVADLPGTTAIAADSSAFVEWASGCVVQRGYMNIADTTLGYASDGYASDGVGPADNYIVSLGDGGIATLTFNYPIYNGDGFDFAVFENGFMLNDSNIAFLELAFVEVSSDGVHFFRFPSVTHVQDTDQLFNGSGIDGGELYDLAGKYVARYGTPFDLQELADTPGLNVNNIVQVRVIDVVGSIDTLYATHDSRGNIINDPWPTPFASCGFDLDAVGVINAKTPSAINKAEADKTIIYPNPVKQGSDVFVETGEELNNIELCDLSGRCIKRLDESYLAVNRIAKINTAPISAGIYFIRAATANGWYNSKIVVE